jgi:RHS repeat-associated protein
MPTQIVHSSNGTTELTYGGTGERVKKRVYSGGNVTDTYYIGDHFEVKGGETIKYIFAGNLRVAQVKGTTRSFFHKDHLGSSTVMTDASGAELEYSDYAPFGSQRAHTGTNTSDYKYTDQELDAENGLYNYNARLYDPFIGRFISPDTIVPEPYNPQSLNRYSYCLNNPLIYVDPSGHFWEWGEEFWNSLKGLLGQTWQDITDAFSQLGGWLGFGKTATVTVGPLMDDYGNAYGGGSSGGGAAEDFGIDPLTRSGGKKPQRDVPSDTDAVSAIGNELTGIRKNDSNFTRFENLVGQIGVVITTSYTRYNPETHNIMINPKSLADSYMSTGDKWQPYTAKGIAVHEINEAYAVWDYTLFGIETPNHCAIITRTNNYIDDEPARKCLSVLDAGTVSRRGKGDYTPYRETLERGKNKILGR